MPRKTTLRTCRTCPTPTRFNEAAARCRGKHHVSAEQVPAGYASMRPRPDAAENVDHRGERPDC